jgi:hypothetical protein
MACPFFNPAEPFPWHAWPNPPRMPLGDPYAGVCTASQAQVPDGRLRTCCNTGYARGTCPSFPGGDAPDAVRFGIVQRQDGVATIRYVVERDHHPFDHGTLLLQESGPPEPLTAGPAAVQNSVACAEIAAVEVFRTVSEAQGWENVVERQARAFLHSYLRRRSGDDR